MTRARNLANLGNKNALTADVGLFNIGIGSTQPTSYKLEVVGGNAYVGGGVTITGNLSVGGTVTYEDVTNVDAVGIITANKGVNIVGGGLTCVGIATFFGDLQAQGDVSVVDTIYHSGDTNTKIRFPAADTFTVETAGSERFRIDSSGRVMIGTTTEGHAAADNLTVADTGNSGITIRSGTSNNGALYFSDGTSGSAEYKGAVRYSHSDNALDFYTNGSTRLLIDSSGRLQIGHTAGIVGGRVEVHATTAETQITINESSDSGTGPALYLNRTRGSDLSSPTPIQNGNYMGSIHFGSYDTNSYEKGASIEARADGQTWADGDCPARLQFLTTPDGSTTPTERLRIHAAGNIACGDTNDLSESSEYALVVHPNRSDSTRDALGLYIKGIHGQGGGTSEHSISLRVDNTNTWNNATHQYGVKVTTGQQLLQPGTGVDSNVTGLYSSHKCFNAELNKNLGAVTEGFSYFSNVVPTNSGGAVYHFFGQDNGTTKVYIEQDGDIKNANNSYGSSSDVKLKENIVDAGSQWDDIKGLRIRNFNFKSDPDKVKMLGVVAQEAEPISPGLIDTQNDIETDETTGMGTVTGTTKYVKYSILYMKAVKALQEAQTRIETLETKVAALEGG